MTRHRLLDALVALSLALATAAAAHETPSTLDFRQAPSDTLPWGMLSKVGLQRSDGRFVPQFLPPLRALQGRRITLYGYMTAQPGRRLQQRFLLSPRPLICAECGSTGPQEIVEVLVDRRIARTDRPLAVRGRLALLEDSPDGLLFRLEHAFTPPRDRTPPRAER